MSGKLWPVFFGANCCFVAVLIINALACLIYREHQALCIASIGCAGLNGWQARHCWRRWHAEDE